MNCRAEAIDTFVLLECAGTGTSCSVVPDICSIEEPFVMKMTPGATLKEKCKNLVHHDNIAVLAC